MPVRHPEHDHKEMVTAVFMLPSGRHILDYGIGGGFFGEFVMKRGARFYTGVDISQKSLDTAAKTLSRYRVKLVLTPVDFGHFKPDIVTSLAVTKRVSAEGY